MAEAVVMTPDSATHALHDIVLPGAVSPWPPLAIWLLLIFVVLSLAALAGLGWRRHRRAAPIRAARQALTSLDPNAPTLPLQVQALLKRTALAYGSRESIADLSDTAWYQWLDQQLPEAKRGQWPRLMGSPYSAQPNHGGKMLLNHAEVALPRLMTGRRERC
ncbi:DUF4381 domain-containing protein [Marinobacter hydrocarbonoclasticus]|nr:DUF4381 domain-containing protein [Marinobacter nauticus]